MNASVSAQRLSVILATYEFAPALDLLLHALAEQDGDPCQVLVADDGSGDEIASVVDRWRPRLDLVHVWQPDEGFRKARALNLAVLAAEGDYLLFLDADCVPRSGLLEAVRHAARPGWFLATKRVDLGPGLSQQVLERQLPIWRWSLVTWLLRGGGQVRRPGYFVPLRDRRRPWRPDQPDFSPNNAYGFCLGVSRADYERVNGYDMRFVGHGNEDVDLVLRLQRIGLRCGWPGPGATMFHLWHPRAERARPNEPVFFETRDSDRFEAVLGLRELAAELGTGVDSRSAEASALASAIEER